MMNSRRNLWLLSGLHALLALSIPVLILLISGCMKARAQKEDLGPEIPTQTIDDALAKIEKSASFNNLKVSQYLVFTDTRRIENSDNAVVLGAKKIQVVDRVDTTDQARFTFLVTNSIRLVDGKFETTTAEEALWLDKVSSAASAPALSPLGLQRPAGKITAESLSHSRDVSVDQPQRISFHNFRENDGVVAASSTLQKRSDCAGLNPCEIPAHFLHFDMVLWHSDGSDYQKISFDFAYSVKTPFLPLGNNFDQLTGLMVADCRATYIPLETRTVYVRDCLTLDDFQN